MNPPEDEPRSLKRGDSLLAKAARANSALRHKALHNLKRARTRLLVCFWTLPVYIATVWILLGNGRSVNSIMWVYMGLYALFAVDMARRNCPECGKQFFVKNVLLNLRTKRCVHCDLPLNPSANHTES